MKRPLLVADLFCGAGGTSTGARRALAARGLAMSLVAVNHWPIAVETHKRNHPDARHYCVDVYKTNPRDAVPGGRLDLLMASPTCTFFSRARGGRPISHDQRRGRMTPVQVVRWCSELKVRCLLVENVPEFVEWGPVDRRTGKPNRAKRGLYFRAWLRRLEALGFRVEWRILNSADFGDATTRSRFFLLARSDRKAIRWPTPTHSRTGSLDLFAGGARRWRPAREIIDWSIPGRSIFGRKRPLSPKTLARIYAGAVKFRWPEPFLVILRQHMAGRSLDEPVPAICAGGTHVALAQPVVFQVNQGEDRARNLRGVDEAPLQTIVTRASLGLAEPIVFANRNENAPRSPNDPIPPATTAPGGGIAVVEPLVVRSAMHKSNALCVRSADSPLATVTTDGGLAVVEAFIVPQGTDTPARSVERPLPTATTVARIALAEPFVLSRHGDNNGSVGSQRSRSVEEPVPTATGSGAGYVVEPFVLSQASGGAPRSTRDPVPTIPTDGAHALVAPVTHADASCRARFDEPLPTITGAHRGELGFFAAAWGEREGQAPRVHSVEEPAPTVCAKGRLQLVEGHDERPVAFDIRFRMLTPRELARAMGFDDEETTYEFSGNKTEVTRQIGNAVPVRTAAALVGAILGDVR